MKRSIDTQRETFLTNDEVSPLDETALVTAVGNSQQRAIRNLTTGAKNDWTDQNRGSPGDETSSYSEAERNEVERSIAILGIKSFPAAPKGRRLLESKSWKYK